MKKRKVAKRKRSVVRKPRQKTSNVVNINRLMHEEAKKKRYKISSGAVREYSSRVVDRIEDNIPELCNIARSHHRKTIMEDDIINFFSMKDNGVV